MRYDSTVSPLTGVAHRTGRGYKLRKKHREEVGLITQEEAWCGDVIVAEGEVSRRRMSLLSSLCGGDSNRRERELREEEEEEPRRIGPEAEPVRV